MTINFSPVLPDYTERRFTDILALEENGQIKLNVYVDTKGLATIGAGFLVSTWAGTILKNMTRSDRRGQWRARRNRYGLCQHQLAPRQQH